MAFRVISKKFLYRFDKIFFFFANSFSAIFLDNIYNMTTQRRNRQRKNRRNSQRRNRKNLQRGGITFFGINILETAKEKAEREAKEKAKREAEEKANREAEEKANRDAELLAKNTTNRKAMKILGVQSDAKLAPESADPSQIGIDFGPVESVEPAGENNNKVDEVRTPSKTSKTGGKQKKSIKKNKKSNKKR